MVINALEYFNGPYLQKDKIIYRQYQQNIFIKCKNKNTLVVLPTGLGKTVIGILLSAYCLEKYKSKAKVVILAPTRPLVSQHACSCEKFLDVNKEEITSFTGVIPPEKRIFSFIVPKCLFVIIIIEPNRLKII